MTEAEIRADERRKMSADLERYAEVYVEKWTPLIGGNRAKATAWEFLVAAKRLAQHPSEKP